MLTQNPAAPLILVVEDDNNHTELIRHSFEDNPDEYRLEFVGTVAHAKTTIQNHSPSIVLTDYRLPDDDGSELVVLAAGAWPVIIMTSFGNEQVAVEAMKIGAQDYIVKSPEVFESLPRTVKYALITWALMVARREVDGAALRAKRDWERTFDAVPDLIAIIDVNHTITRVNKAMADRCSLAPEQLVGRKCYEAVHGLSDVPCCCPSIGMLQDGLVHVEELEEKRLSGIFDVTVSPLPGENGQISAYVHVMRDISGRKKAEKAVLESEKSYRNLMEKVPAIIYSYSNKRGGLFYSPQVEQIFGYPKKAFYDNPQLWRNSIHRDDLSTVEQIIGNLSTEEEQGFDIEYRVCNSAGEWLWLRDSLIQQEILNGEVVFHGIAQDITKLKQAENERQVLESQFQQAQKLESLGVLAGGIAHDFNNILTIIMGHCYMVKECFDSGMTDKEHVEKIESAASRAADLCRQMLAYAGNSPLQNVQINLWLLVDEIIKMLQSGIKKNVTIQRNMSSKIPEILGDAAHIQQVVMNLIINAAEAIGDKKGTITVALKKIDINCNSITVDFLGNALVPGAYACLEVSDDGCGMDEEVKRRIFEPFYTTKFTGRGLGMSAILGIIKSHNGALELTSAYGLGTNFKVYLPLADRAIDVETAPSSELIPTVRMGATILLVDDEEALRTIGSVLLNAMGFSVITAAHGREALEVYRERGSEIDLVMLDLMMPEMGGVEAYRELRSVNKVMPIIICSGYGAESVSEVIDTDEKAGFLHKPYNASDLHKMLHEKTVRA